MQVRFSGPQGRPQAQAIGKSVNMRQNAFKARYNWLYIKELEGNHA